MKTFLPLAGAILCWTCLEAPAASKDSARGQAAALEIEYQKILQADDAAQTEIDRWIRENAAFAAKGAGLSNEALNRKIDQRLLPVEQAYEDFIKRHPRHIEARLAYGSFLNDTWREEAAMQQWEKARQIDPSNPAAWNNLGNYYGHRGPVKKAFEYYAKAIELNPREPVYYHNLGTTVYLFRKDAREHFNCDEQQVFNRAMELYAKAIELDPKNFELATDVAQSYYGIKPWRFKEAIAAWEHALNLARNDEERQGVYLHLARTKLNCGRFDEARGHLELVVHPNFSALKSRLIRNLAEKEKLSAAAPEKTGQIQPAALQGPVPPGTAP